MATETDPGNQPLGDRALLVREQVRRQEVDQERNIPSSAHYKTRLTSIEKWWSEYRNTLNGIHINDSGDAARDRSPRARCKAFPVRATWLVQMHMRAASQLSGLEIKNHR